MGLSTGQAGEGTGFGLWPGQGKLAFVPALIPTVSQTWNLLGSTWQLLPMNSNPDSCLRNKVLGVSFGQGSLKLIMVKGSEL